jgi:hypothetical protein
MCAVGIFWQCKTYFCEQAGADSEKKNPLTEKIIHTFHYLALTQIANKKQSEVQQSTNPANKGADDAVLFQALSSKAINDNPQRQVF